MFVIRDMIRVAKRLIEIDFSTFCYTLHSLMFICYMQHVSGVILSFAYGLVVCHLHE